METKKILKWININTLKCSFSLTKVIQVSHSIIKFIKKKDLHYTHNDFLPRAVEWREGKALDLV